MFRSFILLLTWLTITFAQGLTWGEWIVRVQEMSDEELTAEAASFVIPDVSIFVQVYSMTTPNALVKSLDAIGMNMSFEQKILKGSIAIIQNEIYSQKYFRKGMDLRRIVVFKGIKATGPMASILNYFNMEKTIQEGVDSLRNRLRDFSYRNSYLCERTFGGKTVFIMTIDMNREAWGNGERIGFLWIQFSPSGGHFVVSTLSERNCPRGVGPMDVRLAVRDHIFKKVHRYTKNPTAFDKLVNFVKGVFK